MLAVTTYIENRVSKTAVMLTGVPSNHLIQVVLSFKVLVLVALGLGHPPAPQHVVDDDQAARGELGQDRFVVAAVARLVGIDEDEVEGPCPFGGQQRQRVGRGADTDLDSVRPLDLPAVGVERNPLAVRLNILGFQDRVPENFLDIVVKRWLERLINDSPRTILLVSHDRALLRALTGRIWILHHERITDFGGGFDEWEAASAERAASATSAIRASR